MAESYFDLSQAEAVDILEDASRKAGRQALFIEKDIWNVWCMQMLFNDSFGNFLVFKGVTSLSKAHDLIQRYFEDVDFACVFVVSVRSWKIERKKPTHGG